LAPGEPEGRPEGIGLGELDQRGLRDAGPAPEIVHRCIGLVGPRADDRCGMSIGKPLTIRIPNPTAKRSSSPVGSSVQSHRDVLTQTGRISTPWSRASRTSWAGA